MRKVSVIIINYNTFNLTSNCIRSLIRQGHGFDYEIILVDNASTDSDPEKFLVEFPSIKLMKSSVNGGFAVGNNLGMRDAAGEYILLLNSDTVLTENSVQLTYEYMIQHPEAGVVGCRMVFPDNKIQYSARRFRSIGWEFRDLFRFIPYMMSYKSRANKMLGKYFRHDENRECDWINGAFFMFPKKILQELPGHKLDDRFFMYGEDQLWCEQIKQLGYSILFFAGTTIIHINSGSTDPTKQLRWRRIMMRHELEIMRTRKGRGLYYYLFKIVYVSKESARNVIKSIILVFTGRLPR